MTEQELATIKERCAKAPEGPWFHSLWTEAGVWLLTPKGNEVLATFGNDKWAEFDKWNALGAFLAASRTDVEATTKEIRRLREALRTILAEDIEHRDRENYPYDCTAGKRMKNIANAVRPMSDEALERAYAQAALDEGITPQAYAGRFYRPVRWNAKRIEIVKTGFTFDTPIAALAAASRALGLQPKWVVVSQGDLREAVAAIDEAVSYMRRRIEENKEAGYDYAASRFDANAVKWMSLSERLSSALSPEGATLQESEQA